MCVSGSNTELLNNCAIKPFFLLLVLQVQSSMTLIMYYVSRVNLGEGIYLRPPSHTVRSRFTRKLIILAVLIDGFGILERRISL